LATFKANPKAPGNELLFRIIKVPGGLSLSMLITSSLEIFGLYQKFEVSLIKFGCCEITSVSLSERRLDLRDCP